MNKNNDLNEAPKCCGNCENWNDGGMCGKDIQPGQTEDHGHYRVYRNRVCDFWTRMTYPIQNIFDEWGKKDA